MVKLYSLDAVVANLTDNTFIHKFRLVRGPFGFQELESITSFPPRDGVRQTVLIQTSDVAFFAIIVILATFAIDRYFFRSRYLTHVCQVKKEKDRATVLDEKASLHEKEAFNVEAGRHSPELGSEPKPDTQMPTKRQRWAARAFCTLAVLFLIAIGISDGKKDEKSKNKPKASEDSATDTQTKEKVDTPIPSSLSPWDRYMYGPVISIFVLLSIFVVFAFHLLFWPLLLACFITYEILILENLHPDDAENSTFLWKAIALRRIAYFTVWTIVGVTLVLKPTRFQRKIWMAFRWTHAVTWWLFWGIIESHALGGLMARWMCLSIRCLPEQSFVFIMRPFLVAYLCSGAVCNAASALCMIKYLWDNDITPSSWW